MVQACCRRGEVTLSGTQDEVIMPLATTVAMREQALKDSQEPSDLRAHAVLAALMRSYRTCVPMPC